MNITRSLLALTLVALPLAVGCSHDDDMHHDHDHARVDQTTGDEHHDAQSDAHHTGTQVTTRDTDHDGTDDTVAVEDSGPTALDQGESAADVEITRQIRSAVVSDSSLSFGARNCVIITNGGNVTLRGDVTSVESAAIERHAMAVAGVTHVQNNLHASDQPPHH